MRQTLQDLEYVEKSEKRGKREIYGRTWKMARNMETHGKRETHTVGAGIW